MNQAAILKSSLQRWKGKLRQLKGLRKGAKTPAQRKAISQRIRDVKERIRYYENKLKKTRRKKRRKRR